VDSDLCFLPIGVLAGQVAGRRVSPVEIVTALLARIDRGNSALCSYITVCPESALAAARQAEREIHARQDLPLTAADLEAIYERLKTVKAALIAQRPAKTEGLEPPYAFVIPEE
jgi:Asp-tRNA(Asn)/Glu-tRNA(Gln) amidotransferase A subunit family amidase